jgi:multidrug efflux pump subunit AcrB
MTTVEAFSARIDYTIIYDPTQFIRQSVDEVQKTIAEAILLVVLVVILFLQSWRAAVIPLVAIPISLIGTFFFMAIFGFTLNNLSLFGLVLAVGIVVDDAIVVVENMERNVRAGLSGRDAARKTMEEVGGALVAMGLVLVAVFLPTMFLQGISGKFYQAFGVTIAVATIISLLGRRRFRPALCAFVAETASPASPRFWEYPLQVVSAASTAAGDIIAAGRDGWPGGWSASAHARCLRRYRRLRLNNFA